MPTCQNCHTEWTWLETLKNIFSLTCPHCKTKQYQSASSKKQSMVMNVVFIVIIFFKNVLLDVSLGVEIGIITLLFLLLIGTLPFYLQLANEEEYWF